MTTPESDKPAGLDLKKIFIRPVQIRDRESDPGAKVTTVYVARQMKAFAIHEYEIDSIGVNNSLASIFFSLGSAAFALATGIWINTCFTEKLTPPAEIMSKFVAPVCLVGCVVFLFLGGWALRKRTAIWERIREESKHE